MYTLTGLFLAALYVILTASAVLLTLYVIVPRAARAHRPRYRRANR